MGFLWTAETELKDISELARGADCVFVMTEPFPFVRFSNRT